MILEAERVSKIYRQGMNRVPAVRDADISIAEGERILIGGPSGAGKSTLLHILGGLDAPTKGRIMFRGRDLYGGFEGKRARSRNRAFGFVFQFYHLLPELNVLENVLMPARIGGSAKAGDAKRRAMTLLEKTGMSGRIRHRPSQLSGGEAQRTAIARALINSPEILFCDEPTGNLDSVMSRQIHDLIMEISRENNMALLVVSHQETGAPDDYDKRLHMRDGILEMGKERIKKKADADV
ncbi:MAG: ATP-binding cassette domain-containing protein [Candidatus Omnitrophica bacterium]|nr:ATP-binding cassette domain-containing protein [Candidatus Omnitrophota bacterium]